MDKLNLPFLCRLWQLKSRKCNANFLEAIYDFRYFETQTQYLRNSILNVNAQILLNPSRILTLIYFYKSFEIENLKFLFWEFVKSLQTFYCFLRYNQPDRNLIHFSVKTISNILCQTILGNEVFNLASPSSNLDSNPQRGRNKWPLRQINKTMPAKVNPIMKWIDSILPFKPVWWDLLLGESMSIGDTTPATRVEVDF